MDVPPVTAVPARAFQSVSQPAVCNPPLNLVMALAEALLEVPHRVAVTSLHDTPMRLIFNTTEASVRFSLPAIVSALTLASKRPKISSSSKQSGSKLLHSKAPYGATEKRSGGVGRKIDNFLSRFCRQAAGVAFPRGKAHREKGPRRGYHCQDCLPISETLH